MKGNNEQLFSIQICCGALMAFKLPLNVGCLSKQENCGDCTIIVGYLSWIKILIHPNTIVFISRKALLDISEEFMSTMATCSIFWLKDQCLRPYWQMRHWTAWTFSRYFTRANVCNYLHIWSNYLGRLWGSCPNLWTWCSSFPDILKFLMS